VTPILRCLILMLALTLAGCVNQTVKSTSVPPLQSPDEPIPEALLLDVGIAVFDPGLEAYEEDTQVYPEVRKAEARYMPRLLAEAMQNSGAWGAVRVVPSAAQITDLRVEGKILHSDGEELELHIRAHDSRNQEWLDKEYSAHASRYAYDGGSTRRQYDPFQAVYHEIANDLLQAMEKLASIERGHIRLVTELRFARSFSPDAFGDYLRETDKGRYKIERLPAENDPMLQRIRSIRERDHLFVDTMQEYYGSFSGQMYSPYQEWRKLSYEEAVALQELKDESMRRLIAGGVAVLAGIAAAGGGEGSTRAAGNVAIIGGGYLLKSGLEKRNEAQIHVEALEELGMSLEAEITPHVIELEDRTVMLSGNVEDQYAQWREILADIYRAEIGELEALPAPAAPGNDS
jgi:outer membrane lipoprotein SlyB